MENKKDIIIGVINLIVLIIVMTFFGYGYFIFSGSILGAFAMVCLITAFLVTPYRGHKKNIKPTKKRKRYVKNQ